MARWRKESKERNEIGVNELRRRMVAKDLPGIAIIVWTLGKIQPKEFSQPFNVLNLHIKIYTAEGVLVYWTKGNIHGYERGKKLETRVRSRDFSA